MANQSLNVVILGAASGIAEATARLYASEGASLALVGRNRERLAVISDDLKVRGARQVELYGLDFATANAESKLGEISAALGGIDHLLVAYGIMTDQAEAEHDLSKADAMIDTNFASTARWVLAGANLLEQQGHGSMVVLGSPAGDRGRRKNYIYGATKAGIATLVQGVAHRFADRGPRAVLLKPGPTATAMTSGLPGDASKLASPVDIAKAIRRAADRGGPIQYAPAKWRLIMRIVREIPAPIFNKLNF